jgi:hypothetical protein
MKKTRTLTTRLPSGQLFRGGSVLSLSIVLLFTVGRAANVLAQGTETGRIMGTVTDPAKAVVPQADV